MPLIFFALALASPLTDWVAAQPERDPVRFGYQNIAPAFAEVAVAVEARPARVRTEIIGHTGGGEPIWAFHVAPRERPTRKVLVVGGIHALEWISTEVALSFLHELVVSPVLDADVTVIPLLNPDGRMRVEHDLHEGENRYRRGNWNGVDLNRDFAVNREARAVWKAVLPTYYRHSEAPLSQPESRALDTLLARESYDRMASLHAFGGYLYYPWSGRFARPADWETFSVLGRAMERAQGAHAYRTRQLARWGFFFRAQGSEIDHAYGTYGTRAFLIELTRSGFDPRRPLHSYRTFFRWYNPRRRVRHVKKGVSALRALTTADAPPVR